MIGNLHFLKNEAFTSILFIKVSHKQNYNIGKKYNNPNLIGLYVVSKKSMFNQIQRCFKGLDNKNSLISIKIHHMFRNWFGIQTWKKLLENQNFNYGIQEN